MEKIILFITILVILNSLDSLPDCCLWRGQPVPADWDRTINCCTALLTSFDCCYNHVWLGWMYSKCSVVHMSLLEMMRMKLGTYRLNSLSTVLRWLLLNIYHARMSTDVFMYELYCVSQKRALIQFMIASHVSDIKQPNITHCREIVNEKCRNSTRTTRKDIRGGIVCLIRFYEFMET